LIKDVYQDFSLLGVTVWGISQDSVTSHKKFRNKFQLPFDLLSDRTKEVIESYDAWQPKSMFGKKFLGIKRISYLLNQQGIILRVYNNVDPASHAVEVLNDIRYVIKSKT
jgi:thioredoxin-dependent peroxiredoxin